MSERAIQQIKRKFILWSTVSFAVVMLFMGGLIYLANLITTRNEIRTVLDLIVENDGELPENSFQDSSDEDTDDSEESTGDDGKQSSDKSSNKRKQLSDWFGIKNFYDSDEFDYAVRYFSVIFPADSSEDPEVKIGHVATVDEEEALEYANEALNYTFHFGRSGDYYYKVQEQDDGTTIVAYMDCTSQNAISARILLIALLLIGCGMIIAWLLLRAFSGRVVQTEVKNAELQKQFITNASHELKTPLAVIRANTELMEMMNGESEWTASTMRQVERLQGLIQNLVLITRSQEQDSRENRVPTNVTDILKETAETFAPVASQEEKAIMTDLEDSLYMVCEGGQIRQLAVLLTDNAIKYCDVGGQIRVILHRKGRQVRLAVSNDYKEGENVDYERFFDRFYREDSSRNVDAGGYGIGLSIAQNLVEQYRGSIDVDWKDGVITFTCMLYGYIKAPKDA